jgi:tetratricopeptide (TPR) repeat protein/cellulose biosynthesis protein BcsQ
MDGPYIFTFFASRPGIGRSMALMNTAYALAMRGRNVLAVDLDCERPGLSSYLVRNKEFERLSQSDSLNLLAWAKGAAASNMDPNNLVESPGLDSFISSPLSRKLKKCVPPIGEIGRLDFILADTKRAYVDRRQALGLDALSTKQTDDLALIVRAYLRRQSFYHGPEYYGQYTCKYDYVLVDCPHGLAEANNWYLDPLADRLVICTDLDDQEAKRMRAFLGDLGIDKQREEGDRPWDSADAPISRIVSPRLGPKPTMIVTTPVPVAEIEQKKQRLGRIHWTLGPAAAKLTYHPHVPFNETPFVRDYKEESLTDDYNKLTSVLQASVNDHPAQLARRATDAFLVNDDAFAGAELALRIVPELPELGSAILRIIKPKLSPRSDEEFRITEEVLRNYSKVPADEAQTMLAWGNTLQAWAQETKDDDLAQMRRHAATGIFDRVKDTDGAGQDVKVSTLFQEAALQVTDGDAGAAMSSFDTVINMDGVSAEKKSDAFFNRGVLREEANDLAGAIADYTKIIELPGVPPARLAAAYFSRGSARDEQGDRDGAISDWTAVLDIAEAGPNTVAQALYNRGVSHKINGNHVLALEDWTAILDAKNASMDIIGRAGIARGAIRRALQQFDQAIEDFDFILEQPANMDPDVLAEAYYNRGLAQSDAGRADEALSDWQKILEIEGAPAVTVAQARIAIGMVRHAMGKLDGAVTEFTAVIDDDAVGPEELAEAHYNRGVVAKDKDDYEAAFKDWETVIGLDGAPAGFVANAYITRGVVYGAIGKNQEALSDLAAVIDMADVAVNNLADALLNRGIVHNDMSESYAAIADFNRVIELDGAPVELKARAQYSLALAHRNDGKLDDAIKVLDGVIGSPNSPSTLRAKATITRGVVKGTKGDRQGAIADFKAAIDNEATSESRRVSAYGGLAKMCLEEGKAKHSVEACREALALRPDITWIRAYLGLGLLHLGQTDQALSEYGIAIDSIDDPDHLKSLVEADLEKFTEAGKTLDGLEKVKALLNTREQELR